MRIRQIALATTDLATVREQLFDLLGLDDAFVDEDLGQFGLQNIVCTIGNSFLEVVSPITGETAAGRLLKRRGGDSGYMVIVQVDDCAAAKVRLEKTDIRVVWEVNIGKANALHLHPRDVPGALPSLDEMTPPEAWYWAGPDWDVRAARHVTAITAAQLQVQEPAKAAECWALAYDTVVESRDGCPLITMEDTEVRFVPIADGRGEGLQAIDLRTKDLALLLGRAKKLDLPTKGNSVTVCGTVFNFHQ